MELYFQDRERRDSCKDRLLVVAMAMLLLVVACGSEPAARPAAGGDEQATGSEHDDRDRALAPRTIVIPPPTPDPAELRSPETGVSPAPTDPPTPRQPNTDVSPTGDPTDAPSPPVTYVPPPPVGNMAAVQPEPGDEPVFTPPEVEPQLRNRQAFLDQLVRQTSALWRQGIYGTVSIDLFIDERGRVQNTRVNQSSGHPEFDRLIMQLLHDDAEFSPAMNRGQNVATWFTQTVTREPYTGR